MTHGCRCVAAWLAAGAVLLAGSPARGDGDGVPGRRKVGFLLRVGLDAGGDELVKVSWSDGDTGSIKAGQLFTVAGGVLYRSDAPWAVEGTIGYKFDKVNGSNGSIQFSRIPIDLIVDWTHGGHRLGAGPTVHLAPKLSCDASGTCDGVSDVSYRTAIGGILQYAYGFPVGLNGGFDVGVRCTVIRYSGSGLRTIDGTSAGVIFGGWL